MRRALIGLFSILTMAAAAQPALAGGNANFLFGLRALDEDDWEPIEEQGVFGVTVDCEVSGTAPVAATVDVT